MKIHIRYIFLVTLISLLLSSDGFAKDGSIDVGELNEAVTLENKPSASDKIEKKFESFLKAFNAKRAKKGRTKVSFGQEFDGGKIFITGYGRISGNANSTQWIKKRSMTFTTAYMNAMENFAMYQSKKVRTKIGKSIFQDDSTDAGHIPTKKLSDIDSIWEKTLALTGAKLNNALVEAGVDPEKYNATPVSKRKMMFFQSIIKKTITTASASIQGFLPVKTYEGKGSDGTYGIGVICMYSPKSKQIAIDISHQRLPVIGKSGGKNIIEYINKLSAKQLLNSFGPRLIFDKNGEPAIISFGQWGYSYTGKNANKKERMKINAKENARLDADSNIAMLLKGSMSAKNEVEVGMETKEFMEQIGDDFPVEKLEQKMVDILKKESQVAASANMAGTMTAKTWHIKHPNGQDLVGVVQILTFSDMRGAKAVRDSKPYIKKVTARAHHKNIDIRNDYVDDGAGMEIDDF